jgi:hypothetical protein
MTSGGSFWRWRELQRMQPRHGHEEQGECESVKKWLPHPLGPETALTSSLLAILSHTGRRGRIPAAAGADAHCHSVAACCIYPQKFSG